MKKLLLIAMGVVLLAGCGKADSDAGFQELEQRANKVERQDKENKIEDKIEDKDSQGDSETSEQFEAADDKTYKADSQTDDVQNTEKQNTEKDALEKTEIVSDDSGFRWGDATDREFWFASGAGGWATYMTINSDGSFEGNYHDSDMGDTGEGYPGGTLYYCDFTGRFSEPKQVDEYTWQFELEDLYYTPHDKPEEIIDEVLYVYSGAYGLEGGHTFYMYMPGTPLDKLPEEYLSWVGYYDLSQTDDTELPYYGLYNVEEQEGFSSYEVETAYEMAKSSLDGLQTRYDERNKKLESAMLNQIELNQLSGEQYKDADETLNYIWSLIKSELPESRFNAVLEEQRAWIKDKEKQVAAEGEQWGQGTMRPLAENTVAASMTLKRCYELVEYLK